jgi:hypothetical protein
MNAKHEALAYGPKICGSDYKLNDKSGDDILGPKKSGLA